MNIIINIKKFMSTYGNITKYTKRDKYKKYGNLLGNVASARLTGIPSRPFGYDQV